MTMIAVIGLCYVGLSLVVEFGKRVRTICFDISSAKVKSYRDDVALSRERSEAGFRVWRL